MTQSSTAKTKAKTTGAPLPRLDLSQFGLSAFGLPKFDAPKMEAPAALRDMAAHGIAQSQAAYEKAKAAVDRVNGVLERSYAAAAEGTAEYNRLVVDAARANVNAGFDYAIALLAVKSPTDVVEVSAEHAREQFQAFTEQAKALGELAGKLATQTIEPFHTGAQRAFRSA